MSKQLPMFEDDYEPQNDFERRRIARVERLKAAAERARKEAQARYDTADKMASVIPFGQPILVGHYSEQRDRNYRERIHTNMRKGSELRAKANDLDQRAEAAARNRAIFSDDPNAAEKIDAKIARLQARQELMKAANKCVRKEDREGLAELGFNEIQIVKLFETDFCGRLGFPDYALTNNGANIRRLKQRLETIEAHADDETSEIEIGSVTIEDNVEDNRLRIFFPGKPDSQVRAALKSHGFRWAPSVGAWQRNRSNQAIYWARQIVTEHYGE